MRWSSRDTGRTPRSNRKRRKIRSFAFACSAAILAAGLAAGCGGDDDSAPDAAPPLPEWHADLPPAGAAIGVRRGLTPARGIIHLHSPFSHDACDGDPRAFDGALDEDCLADLKRGLCTTRMDYAALTEHDDSMADDAFEDLLLVRGNDELIEIDSEPRAARVACESGHTVVLFTGGENDLMPIMIDRHPAGTAQQRHDFYNANSVAAVQAFADIGGMTVIPHAEGWTTDEIRALAPAGLEVYQLHANIDPGIRADDLGLDGPAAIQAVLEFADTSETGPEPDLALLSFLEPNTPSITHWDALLGEGMRLFGTAGTDAHQNALPIEMRDGERGDSYRRMIRWFSNVALVTDRDDPAAIEDAVRAGRLFIAFELFGTPVGFDAVAGDVEIGGEVEPGATLTVTVPTVYELDDSLPAPVIRARILRVNADGTTTEVAAGAGPTVEATLTDDGPAYRVEVLITPHHLGPYLGSLGTEHAEREQVWVYSNPFYLTSNSRASPGRSLSGHAAPAARLGGSCGGRTPPAGAGDALATLRAHSRATPPPAACFSAMWPPRGRALLAVP
jgi:hypothetical protein